MPRPSPLLALALVGLVAGGPTRADEFPLRDGRRVVFLGDSITQAGIYIQDIEAYLVTRFPDRRVEIINLGLSSETASGLTEPEHPYPRPDVRNRLARALELARPDLVLVCYGMNDGIYHPPSDARAAAYRQGIAEVVDRCRAAGAEVIVATPPPFDPVPIRTRLRPAGASLYTYKNPYANYDDTLGLYAGWLVASRPGGHPAVDVHAAINRQLAEGRRTDPGLTRAPDGVHPDAAGHWLMAQAYLEAWDAPAEVDRLVVDAASLKATAGSAEHLRRDGDALAFAWTTRIPMPHDPRWPADFAGRAGVDARFNRHTLAVLGLDRPRYDLIEGDKKVGTASREEWAAGVDLLRFADLSTNRRAAELRPLVTERHAILAPSWLQAVGHEAPKFPPTLSLDEAKARARPIEGRICELARPMPVPLRLVPVAD